MTNLGPIACLLFIISFSSYSKVKYDPSSNRCPVADTKNRYIAVPVIHDLKAMATIESIPNIELYSELLEEFQGMEISVYYELINEYDETKETVILIPGGPGESHTFVHYFVDEFKGKSNFFEKYNVIAMDHRGLGCSRPTFPGHEPSESLTMKFAASDIELIRRELNIDKKIHVWGYSYGSMLAQTYGLLYPQSVDKLFLGGAFSAADDFKQAKRDYIDLVSTSSVGVDTYNQFTKEFPDFKNLFLDYTTNQMYGYEGRVRNIPKTLESVIKFLRNGEVTEARELLSSDESTIMPWMMRSISCIEIADHSPEDGVYQVFGGMFKYCEEFSKISDLFNYTSSLKNLPMETFIWGGKYDHVTPAKAMKKMAKRIPNNFLYIDQHLGHGFFSKMNCFASFMDAFFGDKSKKELDLISKSSSCTAKPVLELK